MCKLYQINDLKHFPTNMQTTLFLFLLSRYLIAQENLQSTYLHNKGGKKIFISSFNETSCFYKFLPSCYTTAAPAPPQL